MSSRRLSTILLIAALAVALVAAVGTLLAEDLTPNEAVGKDIFFDQNLSVNRNQSCAACHAPEVGWTGPNEMINQHGAVYEGSIPGRFGNRKPPASAYATTAPILHYSRQAGGLFVGGNFWDGRATGEKLGNPAADQAQGPPLNPLEAALPDKACVVYRVCTSPTYGGMFQEIWGAETCAIAWPDGIDATCSDPNGVLMFDAENQMKVDKAYDTIALSIAAYEGSKEVNAFTSKYDAFLAGKVLLTRMEQRGRALFNGRGKCARCHVSNGLQPLFTDYTYDNLGVPRNPENPFYTELDFNPLGEAWIDLGLGEFLASRMDYAPYAQENFGKQKVPTLRNVDKRPYPEFVKAFGHNGYFKSLKEVVHFYNTRDVLPECAPGDPGEKVTCWPPPEAPVNVNTTELGNLGLTDREEDAIVAFLKTLTDGFMP